VLGRWRRQRHGTDPRPDGGRCPGGGDHALEEALLGQPGAPFAQRLGPSELGRMLAHPGSAELLGASLGEPVGGVLGGRESPTRACSSARFRRARAAATSARTSRAAISPLRSGPAPASMAREGLPPAANHPQHRRRRRADRPQPLPHRGRRRGAARAGRHHHRARFWRDGSALATARGRRGLHSRARPEPLGADRDAERTRRLSGGAASRPAATRRRLPPRAQGQIEGVARAHGEQGSAHHAWRSPAPRRFRAAHWYRGAGR
jgi:hypothetical protein